MRVKAMMLFVVYTIICAGILMLVTGCSTADRKYIECLARDNTSNPCN
jgi:hypothetical protein